VKKDLPGLLRRTQPNWFDSTEINVWHPHFLLFLQWFFVMDQEKNGRFFVQEISSSFYYN